MTGITERLETYLKKFFIFLLKVLFQPSGGTPDAPGTPRRILVVRQHDQLGDMLCSVPLLRALREKYPASQLTLIASPVSNIIMRNHPFLHEVLCYDKRRFWGAPFELVRFFRTLRRKDIDLAIVPGTVSVSMTSDLIAFFSHARARVGVKSLNGRDNPSSFCFTAPVELDWRGDPHRHQSRRNLDILKPSRITTEDLTAVIGITQAEREEAERFLRPFREKHRYLFGFHPGAGKAENRWPAEHFASVANRICREHAAMALISKGPMDNEPVDRMLRALDCPYTIFDQAIRETAAVIDQIDLMITNDTGIMHIAGAMSTKMIAVFGPTDPLEWAPIGIKNRYIKSKDGNINSVSEEDVYRLADLCIREK